MCSFWQSLLVHLESPDELAGIVGTGEGLLVVDGKVDEVELGVQDGEGPGRAARGDVEHPEGSGQLAVNVRYHRELDPLQPGHNIILYQLDKKNRFLSINPVKQNWLNNLSSRKWFFMYRKKSRDEDPVLAKNRIRGSAL